MNSHQRRGQRVFVHEITIHAQPDQPYFRFDFKVEQARQWLQWNAKRRNYIVCPKLFNKQTFKFRNAGMASVFALKFL
jgi:hypothetical protein